MTWTLALAIAASPAIPVEPGWTRDDDPLALGLEGKIYCANPDYRAKTCEAKALYTKGADGILTTVGIVPISNDPQHAVHMTTKLQQKNNEICTSVTAKDVANMAIWDGSEKLKSAEAKELLVALRQLTTDTFVGKKVCEYHFQKGGAYRELVTIDGVEREDFATDYIWLAADTDYTLHTDNPIYGP